MNTGQEKQQMSTIFSQNVGELLHKDLKSKD